LKLRIRMPRGISFSRTRVRSGNRFRPSKNRVAEAGTAFDLTSLGGDENFPDGKGRRCIDASAVRSGWRDFLLENILKIKLLEA
jgi:hypothetical protein